MYCWWSVGRDVLLMVCCERCTAGGLLGRCTADGLFGRCTADGLLGEMYYWWSVGTDVLLMVCWGDVLLMVCLGDVLLVACLERFTADSPGCLFLLGFLCSLSTAVCEWKPKLCFVQNQEPGAEEAFKILGHAFEMIGEPVSMPRVMSSCFHSLLSIAQFMTLCPTVLLAECSLPWVCKWFTGTEC